MMKSNKVLTLLSLFTALTLASCNIGSSSSNNPHSGSENGGNGDQNIKDYVNNKEESGAQFDFDGNYTAPELAVDGDDKDIQYQNSSEILTFGLLNQAKMKMYRGENALFCFFTVDDPDIQTVGTNNGDDVTKGDSVEIYFDCKNDGSKKPNSDDIQINIGAHGKTRIFVGSNGTWGSWNGLLDYEIKLNGTLNDSSDTDVGYTVELMVPYSQIGIDKNSTFGVSLGHVARGRESTAEGLQYTWGPLVFDGNFIDPQCPEAYILSMGTKYYSKGNEPVGNLDLSGKVVDLNGNLVEGATIKVGGQEATSGSTYSFDNLEYDKIDTIEVSKDGYQTYTYKIPKSMLRTESGNVKLDVCLLETTVSKTITMTGVVKNPVENKVSGASVSCGSLNETTDADGKFTFEVTPTYDLTLDVSKTGYKGSSTSIDLLKLVGKSTVDVGVISLYSPSSYTTFAGTKGIALVNAEIYRGFEGLHFLFKTERSITNGSKIELFIDTKHSFAGRDYSDYRLDLDNDGNIRIENYGSGENNIVSTSGITNNNTLVGTTYNMEIMIPYSFLGIENTEVVGVSFGVYDGTIKDWDGWGFEDTGFVAPEYSDQYVRIGRDNLLYRSSTNTAVVNRVSGKVVDSSNNPIKTAKVNGTTVNEDGTFRVIVSGEGDVTLTIEANGYTSVTKTFTQAEFVNGVVNYDVTLVQAIAIVSGTCNVDGAKVYLESNPTVTAVVANGTYTINIPTDANAKLVFEATGYTTKTISIGRLALVGSATNNTPITKNVTLEQI